MKNRLWILAGLSVAGGLWGCGPRESAAPGPAPLAAPAPAGAAADLPGPRDLPPCPGFLAAEQVQGNAAAGSAVLCSSETVAAVLDFYTTQLAADGWVLGTAIKQGEERHLQFTRGSRFLRLQLGPAEEPSGATQVLLAWKGAAAAVDADDAHAPEELEPEPDIASEGSVEW